MAMLGWQLLLSFLHFPDLKKCTCFSNESTFDRLVRKSHRGRQKQTCRAPTVNSRCGAMGHEPRMDVRRRQGPVRFPPPGRISLVGLVLSQVLEGQRAALDELVQGLLRAHQLLQLLPQLLLLPRPGGVFKHSPASGNRAVPQYEPQSTSRGPNPRAAVQTHTDGAKPQNAATGVVYHAAPWAVPISGPV